MAAFRCSDARDSRPRPGRRALLRAAAGLAALACPAPPFAQVRTGRPQVGFLAPDALSTRMHEGFLEGMQALGYAEGRTYGVEWRFAGGRYDRLPQLAAELVTLRVQVIVAGTTLGVQAAQQATKTIPIVMVGVPDPVGEGFAGSLSRPGRNITGLSNIATEVSAKHVELLQAVLPRLARLALLLNPLNPSDALILEQVQGAAYARGLKLETVEASSAPDLDSGFARLARARTEAVIVAADGFFDVQAARIARLAIAGRLPTIFSSRTAAEAGALMSYGQDLAQHYRRAASYVDKILKGATPATLPIEQPTILEFVVNLRAASALGLAMPRELLVRADHLIE